MINHVVTIMHICDFASVHLYRIYVQLTLYLINVNGMIGQVVPKIKSNLYILKVIYVFYLKTEVRISFKFKLDSLTLTFASVSYLIIHYRDRVFPKQHSLTVIVKLEHKSDLKVKISIHNPYII